MQNNLSGNEIREKFLNFFEHKHQSTRVKSSSLIPDNPTVLLTTAGMLQFVPIFLGYEKPPYSPARATTCQKCARAGGKDSDIENVGRTPRHHTFFEMLGNFSFGDYFKKEIIPWSLDFIFNELKLEKDRIWITVYKDDDEALELWEKAGIDPSRILKKGKKDNFWGPPGATGPCGPCTEIHYDLGKEFACSDNCSIDTCECDRWVEIWNLVFMELFQDEDGNLTPLEKKNVDTGMGLERIAMVVQNKTSTFDTDLMTPILNKAVELSGKKYKADEKTDVSLRIIADHARCVVFMINDGITPANEGRDYVLRMILRRALRHGKILGLELPFLNKMTDVIVDQYKTAYPELLEHKEKIEKIIAQEENRFAQTLDKGQKILDEAISTSKSNDNCISAEDAFKLYDTFGFPLELTIEIAHENGLKVNSVGFSKLMQEQKERAKNAVQKIVLTNDLIYVDIENKYGKTDFVGYCETKTTSKVIETVQGEGFLDIVLDKTPFYAESGGQVSDIGEISNEHFKAEVLGVFKVNKLFVHRIKVLQGAIQQGEEVEATIDASRRFEITAHHTNAHLLQAALIKVLGDGVKQAGSQVEPNRTRFDFSFPRALTKQEIEKVENIVNDWIAKDLKQTTTVMNIESAKKAGAKALFGEKYDDEVRVVSFGEISKELCGGCHAKSTADLRLFKIVSEGAISAGSRRIEAICSKTALSYLNEKTNLLDEIMQELQAPAPEALARVEKMQHEIKSLQNELGQLKSQIAAEKFNSFASKAIDLDVKGQKGKLFITKIEDFDAQTIKAGMTALESKLGESVMVLVSVRENSLVIIAKATDGFVKQGINAGAIVSKIAKATAGNGGGKPNFAQGGGKDPTNLDKVLEEVKNEILNA